MTAVTQSRNTWYQHERDTLLIPLAADAVVYPGCLACVDGDGYLVDADDADGYKGCVLVESDPDNPGRASYDNTGGSDGDIHVLCRTKGRVRMKLYGRTPQQDMLYAKVYVVDNQTVAVHRWDVTHDIQAGFITRLPADTLAAYPLADFDSDEVEIELGGEPFDWGDELTTTTTAQA